MANIPELPTTITILGKTFKITPMDSDEVSDGSMHLARQEIHLHTQPAIEYNQDTVLHEIIHAVDEMLILKISEKQVHSLAVGLMSVFKQNDNLMKWLLYNAGK